MPAITRTAFDTAEHGIRSPRLEPLWRQRLSATSFTAMTAYPALRSATQLLTQMACQSPWSHLHGSRRPQAVEHASADRRYRLEQGSTACRIWSANGQKWHTAAASSRSQQRSAGIAPAPPCCRQCRFRPARTRHQTGTRVSRSSGRRTRSSRRRAILASRSVPRTRSALQPPKRGRSILPVDESAVGRGREWGASAGAPRLRPRVVSAVPTRALWRLYDRRDGDRNLAVVLVDPRARGAP